MIHRKVISFENMIYRSDNERNGGGLSMTRKSVQSFIVLKSSSSKTHCSCHKNTEFELFDSI